uniref:Uncharacterized protein n=1 Tax=Cannabis sativa TaxID=3483 RepID=A0A803QG05_CANSA
MLRRPQICSPASKSMNVGLDRKLVAYFWWKGSNYNNTSNHYLALKCWANLYQPKKNGGLGLRRYRDMNLALLAKLSQLVLNNNRHHWVQVLCAMYSSKLDFWNVEKNSGDSFVWKGIIEVRDLCVAGVGFLVGKGEKDI